MSWTSFFPTHLWALWRLSRWLPDDGAQCNQGDRQSPSQDWQRVEKSRPGPFGRTLAGAASFHAAMGRGLWGIRSSGLNPGRGGGGPWKADSTSDSPLAKETQIPLLTPGRIWAEKQISPSPNYAIAIDPSPLLRVWRSSAEESGQRGRCSTSSWCLLLCQPTGPLLFRRSCLRSAPPFLPCNS